MRNNNFIKFTLLILAILFQFSCPQEIPEVTPLEKKEAPIPTSLLLNEKWTNSLRFSWKCTPPAEKYHIYRSDSLEGDYINIGTAQTMLYTDKELNINQSYYYKVTSFTDELGESKMSAPLTATTAIESPKEFVVVEKKNNSIKLRWSPVQYATGYRLYRDKEYNMGHRELLTLKNDTLEYIDYNLVEQNNYYYRIQAYNEKTESKLSESLFVPMDVRIPDNLNALWSDKAGGIEITWNAVYAVDPPAAGYRLFRSLTSADGPYEKLIDKPMGTTYYLDKLARIEGSSVYYKITSYYINSSNTVTVSKMSPYVESKAKPVVPKDCLKIIMTETTEKSLTLEWLMPPTGTGVNIYRWVDNQTNSKPKLVKRLENSSVNIFTDTEGIYANTQYTYFLKYFIQVNGEDLESEASNSVSDYTLPNPCEVISLTKDKNTGRAVTITWKEVNDAQEYIIEYERSDKIGVFTTLPSVPTAAPFSYTHSELAPFIGYKYKLYVISKSSGKRSPSTTVGPIYTNPDCPQNVTAESSSTDSITLNWEAVSNIPDHYTLSYKIYRQNSKDTEKVYIGKVDSTLNSFKDPASTLQNIPKLTSNSEYSYYVTTHVNYIDGSNKEQNEESVFSNVSAAITHPAAPKVEELSTTSSTIELKITTTDKAEIFDIYRAVKNGIKEPIAMNQKVAANETVLTYNDTKALNEFTEYSYYAVAKNSNNQPSTESSINIFTKAKAPANFKVDTVDSTDVTLSWSPINIDAVKYKDKVSYIITKDGKQVKTITPGQSLTATFTGLPSNSNHTYLIYATIDVGRPGPILSEEVSVEVLTCPAKPTVNFSGESATGVTVVINKDDTSVLTYELNYNESGTQIVNKSTSQTTNVSPLTPFTEYIFQARAANNSGTTPGDPVTYVTKPEAPHTLNLTPSTTTSQIDLSWSAGANNGSPAGYTLEYRVYRSNTAFAATFNPAAATAIATVNSSDQLSHSDVNLTAGSEYFYRVYAVGVKSGSPTLFSDFTAKSETTKPELAAINSLEAISSSSREVQLTWDKVTDITGYTISYKLYRSTDETFPTNLTDIINVAQPANGNKVEVVEKSITVTGGALTPATKFFYKVVAVATRDANFKPESPDSNVVDAIVDIPQPTGLTIELNAQNRALLTWDNWTAPAGYDVKYLVYYSTTDTQNSSFTYVSPDVAQNNAQAATTTSYTHNDTPNQGVVYYRIYRKAVKSTDANYTPTSYYYSNIVEVLVAPPAPTNLKADENSAGNINLTWTEPTIPTGYTVNYRIYRKTGSAAYDLNSPIATIARGTATYTDTSFDSDNDTVNDSHKRYYYTIKTEVTKNGVTTLGPKATDDADLLHNPAAPTTLTVGEVDVNSSKKVQLSWSAVAKPQDYEVKYHIYRKVGTAANYNFAAAPLATMNGPDTSYIDDSAQSNNHYCYVVKTEVTRGTAASKGESASPEADILYRPAAPSSVTVNENSTGKVELTWNVVSLPQDYTVKYHIYRKESGGSYDYTAALTTVTGPSTTYVDNGAQANKHYVYVILSEAIKGAVNSKGSSASAAADIFYNPAAPAALTIGLNAAGKVELSWTAITPPTGYTIKYHIYRRESGGSYDYTAALTTVTGPAITYVDNSVLDNSRYYYEVRSEMVKGATASKGTTSSNEVEILFNPAAPTGLAATINSTTEVALSWTAPTIPMDYTVEYRIFRSAGNNSSYGASPLATTSSASYTDTTVGGGTDYYYKVCTSVAKNGLTVPGTASSNEIYVNTAPAAPTGLQSSADSNSQLTISWPPIAEPTGHSIEYTIERTTVADNFANITDILTGTAGLNSGTNRMEYIDSSGLTTNTAYRYRVYTVLKKGATTVNISAASAIIDETTLLETPTGFAATYDSGTNKITLSWTAVTGANSYEITVSTGTSTGLYVEVIANETSAQHIDSVTTPASGTTYYYQLKAKDSSGNFSIVATTNITIP